MPSANISKESSSSLLMDMDTALDAARIIHELMLEEICEHILDDAESSKRANERVCVLLSSLKNKLTEAEELREKISTVLAQQV